MPRGPLPHWIQKTGGTSILDGELAQSRSYFVVLYRGITLEVVPKSIKGCRKEEWKGFGRS